MVGHVDRVASLEKISRDRKRDFLTVFIDQSECQWLLEQKIISIIADLKMAMLDAGEFGDANQI